MFCSPLRTQCVGCFLVYEHKAYFKLLVGRKGLIKEPQLAIVGRNFQETGILDQIDRSKSSENMSFYLTSKHIACKAKDISVQTN